MPGPKSHKHASIQAKPTWQWAILFVVCSALEGLLINLVSTYLQPTLDPYRNWVWAALVVVTLAIVWLTAKSQSGRSDSRAAINSSNVIKARTAQDVTQVIGDQGQVFVGSTISSQVAARDIYNITHSRPTPASAPFSAPRVPDNFLGRDDAIKELKKRLGIGKGRKPSGVTQVLTAVHGWPGVGKTSVAAALAHDTEVREAFPDGVLWASLGTEPNIMTELAKWGRALGIDNLEQANDAAEASAILAGLLNDKRMLLLVDDAWDAAHVQPFIVGGTGCAMLVTTRKPDTARAIAPDENARYPLDVLTEENAIELLRRLAPKVVARYPEESRALVIELGCLPLAIQVAGRLLAAEAGRGLGVTELLDDIRKGAALLEAKAPPDLADLVHETTPTVLSLLMKSVDCLDDETKSRFPYLAPFVPKPASFDLAALAYVWSVEDPKPTVRALVDFGLIEPAQTEGRFSTHAIITRLAAYLAKGDTDPWLKHSTCYALLVRAANKTYRKGNEGVLHGLATFNIEWDNIEAGQRWAAVNAETNDSIARMCVDYALGCPDLLSLRLHPREQVLWLESALQCARHLKDRRNEGAALGSLGNACFPLGESRRAIECHEHALEIARGIGDRQAEGASLGNLGLAYHSFGNYRRAIEFHEQAFHIAREIGDRRGEGNALGNLGLSYFRLNDYRHAIEFQERSLQIAREIGDRQGEGSALSNLGTAHFMLSEYPRAIESHEQALGIAREIGDRQTEGTTLGNLGNTYCALGEYRYAIELYGQHLEIARDIGDRQGEGNALLSLGCACYTLGNYRRAIEFYPQALEIDSEIGDRAGEGKTLFCWSLAADKLAERDKAIELMRQALVIFEQIGGPGAEKARKALAEWQAEGG